MASRIGFRIIVKVELPVVVKAGYRHHNFIGDRGLPGPSLHREVLDAIPPPVASFGAQEQRNTVCYELKGQSHIDFLTSAQVDNQPFQTIVASVAANAAKCSAGD